MSKEYKLLVEEQEKEEEKVANFSNQPTSSPNPSDISEQQKPSSNFSFLISKGAPSIVAYCIASILMTITNKCVLSAYDFNMNFLLLCIQSTVCILLLKIFKLFNLISYREINPKLLKNWTPVVFLLVVMIYTGSKSLQFLAIPIYTIFKNLTIIFIAYGEVLWFKGSVTRLMMTSFLLMVFSSIMAASSSDSVDSISIEKHFPFDFGYVWMGFNCISSAAYVLFMRKRIKLADFKDFDTVYYNNILSTPLLIFMSLMVEDWSYANLEKNFPIEVRGVLILSMLFSGLSAFAISFASAWCIRVTSSTTYSMVGALNKLPIAASGMIFFGDPITFGSTSAILIGFFSGVLYSIAKNEQQNIDKLILIDAKITNNNNNNLYKSSTLKSYHNINDPIVNEKYIEHTTNSMTIKIEDDKNNEINQ